MVAAAAGSEVKAECHRLRLKELWKVEEDGEYHAGDDVAHGPLDITDEPVVRLGHRQEPLHCDRDHDEDGAAETQPWQQVWRNINLNVSVWYVFR